MENEFARVTPEKLAKALLRGRKADHNNSGRPEPDDKLLIGRQNLAPSKTNKGRGRLG